jgi:hypothetical protein
VQKLNSAPAGSRDTSIVLPSPQVCQPVARMPFNIAAKEGCRSLAPPSRLICFLSQGALFGISDKSDETGITVKRLEGQAIIDVLSQRESATDQEPSD